MDYAERAYFDGDHCQHVADRNEHLRHRRIAKTIRQHARDGRLTHRPWSGIPRVPVHPTLRLIA